MYDNNDNNPQQQGVIMTDINWDDMQTSNFVSFKSPGDTVTGTIVKVYGGTDYNGNPCPYLDLITEAGEKTVSCGNANLKAQIVEMKPRAGESITITYTHDEKASLGVKKVFKIDHTNPLGATAVPQTEAPF